MKESKRQLQVGEMVRRNIGIVLRDEGVYIYGSEPLVTVTNVKMSPDMGIAKIYLSIYNFVDKDKVIIMLEHHSVKLRQSLGARIRKQVRRIPQISFYIDETLDEMYHLNEVFDKLGNRKATDDHKSEEE